MNGHFADGIVNWCFRSVWSTSFSATVLIVLVLAAQWLLRRWMSPRWLYALWLCVLVRLVLPIVPAAPFSIFNLWHSSPSISNDRGPVHSAVEPPAQNLPGSFGATTGREAKVEVAQAPAKRGGVSIMELAAQVWLAGTAIYLLVILVCHRKLSTWLAARHAVSDPRLVCLIEEARAMLGMRQTVRIFESSHFDGPAVFGFFKPCLLLPTKVREILTERELRLIILHELIHVKRHDVPLNWAIILVQALHWFNPLVWVAMRWLRSMRELVCDATVLTCLNTDERKCYGTTLIKLVDGFSRAALTPSLVPIISHKNETQRRIIMIANFKPTPRTVTIASAILVLLLACLTFTTATEKAEPALETQKRTETNSELQKDPAQRRIAIMQELLDEQTQQLRQREAQLDKLQQELGISQMEDSGQASPGPEGLRKLQSLRIDARAEFSAAETLLAHLRKLSRPELTRSISTAMPDTMLTALLAQQAAAEQKLTELMFKLSTEHPEVKSTKSLMERIQTQINDRLDGILEGLKVKVSSQQARLDQIEKEIDKARRADIETAIQRRPYFQARRDLENMQAIRERLQTRLAEERINAAVGK